MGSPRFELRSLAPKAKRITKLPYDPKQKNIVKFWEFTLANAHASVKYSKHLQIPHAF